MKNGLAILRNLNDLRDILKDLPGPDYNAKDEAVAREKILTKPRSALGRLEDLSAWLCSWQGHYPPRLEYPAAVIFAANHGVAKLGVSAYPSVVTAQMVKNFQEGGAAVNQLCRVFGATLAIYPIDLERPTANFSSESAMEESECVSALSIGIAAVSSQIDILCIGEIGIANTTAAAAISYSLFSGNADIWTGVGSGISESQRIEKSKIIENSIMVHKPSLHDAITTLCYLGGREFAAMVGAIVAARLMRIPVLLDGYICTAVASVLEVFAPGALDHCLISHISAEQAHRILCERLRRHPLLDLSLRLGEASGAVLALGLLKGAVACHNGMATFTSSGVSDRTS